MKHLKKIVFSLLSFLVLGSLLVYAAGTKNILFTYSLGNSFVWVPEGSHTGFSLGTDDYIIYDVDGYSACSYYNGLSSNKVYIPNYRDGELDAFKAHFPTGYVLNKSFYAPACEYENPSAENYTPIGCNASSTMDGDPVYPTSEALLFGTNLSITWKCEPDGQDPCHTPKSCDYSPCSQTGCFIGTFTASDGDSKLRACSEIPGALSTVVFKCSTNTICGPDSGDCFGTTYFDGFTNESKTEWTCRDGLHNQSYSCPGN